MMMFLVAFTLIAVAGIAGWAAVASMSALGRSRGVSSPELERAVERLTEAVADLREDVDAIGRKAEEDVLALEERLDFTERLLMQKSQQQPPDGE